MTGFRAGLRTAVLLVVGTTGCSGAVVDTTKVDTAKYERAIREHSADNLPPYGAVLDVKCRAAIRESTYAPEVFCEFRSVGARWPQWISCTDRIPLSAVNCIGDAPPLSHPIWESRAWALAPKDVTWKCEDVDEQGREIGPVFVSLRDDMDAPYQHLDWRTKAEAAKVARSYGTSLGIDC